MYTPSLCSTDVVFGVPYVFIVSGGVLRLHGFFISNLYDPCAGVDEGDFRVDWSSTNETGQVTETSHLAPLRPVPVFSKETTRPLCESTSLFLLTSASLWAPMGLTMGLHRTCAGLEP